MSQNVKVYRTLTLETGATGESARFLAGNSTTAVSYTAGTPPIALYFTDDNTTSTNSEPFYLKSIMTGAGGYGGRSRFHAYTNVALQTNFMALKAHSELGDSATVAGLAAGFCAELVMPNADITAKGGGYCCLELEYVASGTSLVTSGAGAGFGTFIYMAQSGDANGDLDDNGFLFNLQGCTAGVGHLFDSNANLTNAQIDHTLKILIGTTTHYIPIMDKANGD